MKAMVFDGGESFLRLANLAKPSPREGEVLIQVGACGVCRTDLHIVDGDLDRPKLPLVPGHQIVGRIVETGPAVSGWEIGARVGVPWLGWTCGRCKYCVGRTENLCEEAGFTGYTLDGGFAEFVRADARYVFRIPDSYSDLRAAPLLCAGLIGYRALSMAGHAERLGLYGFGAAAHLVAQLARSRAQQVYAFTRPNDDLAQRLAAQLGAAWTGSSNVPPPDPLDAAIIFAPVGSLVPTALSAVRPGGTVVCAGIHMSDIPSFPYDLLWGERVLRSVANLTRDDGIRFFSERDRVDLETSITVFPLEEANLALDRLRDGMLTGAAVLQVSPHQGPRRGNST
jgi:propanol-preferring alcohol dehydrogenase